MKSIFLIALLASITTYSQYEIGQTSTSYNDPDRSREIETFIFYPADVAGSDVAVSAGKFPVISVGHGFVMTYDYYEYLWEHFVPMGYIVVLPNTETGVDVSHGDYGLDLGYVITAIQAEDENEASLFYEHVGGTSAVIGHSMGGGAAVLAASEYSEINTLVTLAAAETDPSAITAASSVNIPSLTFAGDVDCVTPPAEHQEPIYDNLSDCKGYVLIEEGTHCQFANSNPLCEFGEFSCPSSGLSETEQHAVVLEVLTPWLEAYLKFSMEAWSEVESLEGDQVNYNLNLDCMNAPTLSAQKNQEDLIAVFPNPAKDILNLSTPVANGTYAIYGLDGRIIKRGNLKGQSVDLNDLAFGIYQIIIQDKENIVTNQRFIKE